MANRRAKTKTRSDLKGNSGSPEAVRIRLLGGFEVTVGARSLEENAWRLKKAASLVKLLALAPNHRLHREQVMDILWPEHGTSAASNNLRQTLHAARRTLEPERSTASRYLELQDEQLALCPRGQLWVDVDAFEEAARTSRRSRRPAAYEAALELYAGELLPQDRYEEWAEEHRRRLRETYLSLLLGLARLNEERREYDLAVEVLGRVVSEEPTREEAHVGLMRLYAFLGSEAEALAQYSRLEQVLLKKLGAEPAASSRALKEEIEAGRFLTRELPTSVARLPSSSPEQTPEETPSAPRHNLPAARGSFVGRERELAQIKRELAAARLLTLTGAGGSGKTRLALEVARDLVEAYPDGVWLVELAPLSEGALVPQAVAGALEVPERPGQPLVETLIDALRTKEMLLVVDNCEHLVEEAASLVDELLGACANLRVLATSREALCLEGELRWPVPTLSVPAAHRGLSVAELEGSESVRLFVERARNRDPAFALRPGNAESVAQICRRLDGMPLAIELAAARVKVLSVEQISGRLDESLGLLTAGSRTSLPRQKTLRATIDWSYGLLSEEEQTLFRRLSVFAGGFSLEAAEAVCAGGSIQEDGVLDLLSQLVDKSLVVVQEQVGEARYRMLETVRQYGWEKLHESGMFMSIRRTHANFFLVLAEEVESELKGAESRLWLERLELEHDNLRAALRWAADTGESETELRLVGALWWFWVRHDHVSEGRRWLEDAIGRTGPSGGAAARAKALCGAGFLAFSQIDHPTARARLEESAEIYRQIEDRHGLAYALSFLSLVMAHQGELKPARVLAEEGVSLFQEEDADRWGLGIALANMGIVAEAQDDYDLAVSLFEESVPILRELGDKWYRSIPLRHLGVVASRQGDHVRAERLYKESLALLRELGEIWLISLCLEELAGVACAQGEYPRAARLWGAEETICEAIGSTVRALYRADHERDVAAARTGLGEEAFEEALAQGRTMSTERAIDYALAEEGEGWQRSISVTEPKHQPPVDEGAYALTRREREVALHVARGLTNRQIASELVLSEHTIHHHLTRILKKLNLHSREQIASRLSDL